MRTSLDILPDEILTQICETIFDESRRTLRSVELVNKHLRAVSQSISQRDATLELWRNTRTSERVEEWLGDEELHGRVQQLTIFAEDYREPCFVDSEKLTHLIERIAKLNTLKWQAVRTKFVDPDVVYALQNNHAKAKLTVALEEMFEEQEGSRDWTKELSQTEIALSKSTALTAISMTYRRDAPEESADPDEEEWGRERLFRRVLASAPNLESVSIINEQQGLMRPVPLDWTQNLHYTHRKPTQSVRTLAFCGYAMIDNFFDDWVQLIDLSRVEDFQCHNGLFTGTFFNLAARSFSNLKHLTLHFEPEVECELDITIPAERYLHTCQPLETIEIMGWWSTSLDTILNRHGPSLKKLLLHRSEGIYFNELTRRRPVLSVKDIKKIKKMCPKLEDFSFDLNRKNDDLKLVHGDNTNYEIIHELSTFGSQLNHVQIQYDLGVSHLLEARPALRSDHEWGRPSRDDVVVNHEVPKPSTVQSMENHIAETWKILYGDKRTGQRIMRLRFGEWLKYDGTPRLEDFLNEEHKVCLTAEPRERDDGDHEYDITREGPAVWEAY